jgi:hypothetical protein
VAIRARRQRKLLYDWFMHDRRIDGAPPSCGMQGAGALARSRPNAETRRAAGLYGRCRCRGSAELCEARPSPVTHPGVGVAQAPRCLHHRDRHRRQCVPRTIPPLSSWQAAAAPAHRYLPMHIGHSARRYPSPAFGDERVSDEGRPAQSHSSRAGSCSLLALRRPRSRPPGRRTDDCSRGQAIAGASRHA